MVEMGHTNQYVAFKGEAEQRVLFMVIIIGNLPAQATVRGMCDFARLPVGTHLRIVKKKTVDGGMVRYGLVQISDARQAQRLMERIEGQTCHGNRLTAREYEPRVAGNERRQVNWRQVAWHREERRVSERRTAAAPQEVSPLSVSAA